MSLQRPHQVWLTRPWVWLVPVVFFVLNAAFLLAYRASLTGEIEARGDEVQTATSRLHELQQQHQQLEALLGRVEGNEAKVSHLYQDTFSTERHRLTQIIKEVKELAAKAGLQPASIRYPDQAIEQYGLVKRSFVFSVGGTYTDLRKLINLLELTPSFLTLEEVGLAEGSRQAPGGPVLHINLRLSTLFAESPTQSAASPAVRQPAERGAS